jgi:predicted esterase
VIGFSSGAALAVALLLQEAKLFPTKHLRDPIFKVAVLFACISPVDSVLLSGGFEKPIFLEEGPLIRIPTAHIWGMRDSREQISREVVELCTPEGRRVFTHKGDHEIPGSTDNVGTTAVVHAIQAVIDTAVTTWDNSKILEATYET